MMGTKDTKGVWLLLIFLFSLSSLSTLSARKKEIVIIDSPQVQRPQKEAILVLAGFGSRIQGIKDIASFFAHKGYDLFIPNYIGRDSVGQCVTNLDTFWKKQKLSEYKKIHVFSYIVGSWVINLWIKKNPVNNIASIIYDRSPLQERAPYALVKDAPFLIRLAAGRIMKDFSQTPYPSIPNDEKKLAMLIENRSTKLVRKHRKTVLSLGEVIWDVKDRRQEVDDFFYVYQNHDEMYHELSFISVEILNFIKTGSFSSILPRKPFIIEPFAK
jgi:hypothetical protein